jgi:hypothetical protein
MADHPVTKSIYLTRRKPSFSHAAFVDRWRVHGSLALSKAFAANILSYVQAEIVDQTGADAFDAIACIVVRDHPVTPAELDELGQMVVDEHQTFDGPIVPHLIAVDEEVIAAGPIGGAAAFLFFRDADRAQAAARAIPAQPGARVVLNRRRSGLPADMGTQVPFAAVVEISAADRAALHAWLRDASLDWHAGDYAALTDLCIMR